MKTVILIPVLLDTYPNVQLVVYTEGKNGQRAYTRTAKQSYPSMEEMLAE